MPKNKGKGGKNRRRGKNENDAVKRELIYKEDQQEYAKVEKILGNGRLDAYCFDGKKRLCHIRGKLRKKVWINQGDIILIGLRDYQDAKADVILKYNPDEARNLKTYGEIPDTVKIEEDNDIEFDAQAEFQAMSDSNEDSDSNAESDRNNLEGSEHEESEESEEESDDDNDWMMQKNPNEEFMRNKKWERQQHQKKKNNESFIDNI